MAAMGLKYLCKWGFLYTSPKKTPEIKPILWKSASTTAMRNTDIPQPSVEGCKVTNIPDFYKNKSIFITGATGFVGKVLVERLLATCPDIGTLYLLMREKKGVPTNERLGQLKDCELFDVLRAKSPQQLDKIVAVKGDISRPQLGLTPDERAQIEEVSVVFHVAASMYLEAPLRAAVHSNLRSTIGILELCDRLPKMEVFIYVSTCFSNSELKRVEERVYPPPMDLETLLKTVEHQDLDEEQTRKLTASKPNSYTFTKAMAEHVVEKHGCVNYPVAIFRPAGVVSSLRYPFPGWTENPYGSLALIAGAIAGHLRLFGLTRDAYANMVPVDITVDTLIAAAWEMALDKPQEVRVYNSSNPEDENTTTWGHFTDVVNKLIVKYPSISAVWYPHFYVTNNRYLFWILQLVLHTIPNYMMLYTLRLLSIKSGEEIIKVGKALRQRNKEVWYFSTNGWDFVDGNTKNLRRRISESDKALYNLDLKTFDWNEMLEIMVIGTRRHVFKESDDSLESARARIRKIRYAINASKAATVLAGLTVLSWYF